MSLEKRKDLNERQNEVIDRHLAEVGLQEGVRLKQWDDGTSVYFASSNRLWVHHNNKSKSTHQELMFVHSKLSLAHTLTSTHTIKFWDLRRLATPRETARVQGFPDWFKLPQYQYNKLFGNAVTVPCASYAVSRVCDGAETFVDMCSGVGGFHVAAVTARPSLKCVGFSEILPAAVKCYQDNFPDVPNLGDAEKAVWPKCDLLCAGFPCQPFSTPNNREGIRENHKNKDFYTYVMQAIESTGATRIVLENVIGLLTHGKRQFDELSTWLKGKGFVLDYAVLHSNDFGVPQKRKRIYIVGRRDGTAPLSMLEDRPACETRTLGHFLEEVEGDDEYAKTSEKLLEEWKIPSDERGSSRKTKGATRKRTSTTNSESMTTEPKTTTKPKTTTEPKTTNGKVGEEKDGEDQELRGVRKRRRTVTHERSNGTPAP
jgi:DNA-cytosine methyltransferase